ncbi:ATP-binding protein [Streptomyces sp. NPDC057445]|uniref:ATP-binding protein n=1 Tax=Streptomyces sp. NPDC057445 TaxID=3346136 RepID=UPI003692202C
MPRRRAGLDAASLVISELVGNVAQHAARCSPRATVRLTRTGTMPAPAVHDEHPYLPRPLPADPGQECGRGLLIVDGLALESGGALQVRRVSEQRHGAPACGGVVRRFWDGNEGLPVATAPGRCARRSRP